MLTSTIVEMIFLIVNKVFFKLYRISDKYVGNLRVRIKVKY